MEQKVLFKHCDPAGIVFYPRYFEMMNDLVEAFFDRALGAPFEVLHPDPRGPHGDHPGHLPRAQSRHGDLLTLTAAPTRVGGASMDMALDRRLRRRGTRFTAASTLVHVDRHGRPERWPDAIRAAATRLAPEPA